MTNFLLPGSAWEHTASEAPPRGSRAHDAGSLSTTHGRQSLPSSAFRGRASEREPDLEVLNDQSAEAVESFVIRYSSFGLRHSDFAVRMSFASINPVTIQPSSSVTTNVPAGPKYRRTAS